MAVRDDDVLHLLVASGQLEVLVVGDFLGEQRQQLSLLRILGPAAAEVVPVQAQVLLLVDGPDPADELGSQLDRRLVRPPLEEVPVDVVVLVSVLHQVLDEAFVRELRDLALLHPQHGLVDQLDEGGDLRLHLLEGATELVVDAQVEVLD